MTKSNPTPPLIQTAFSPETFRQTGHELINFLADYLASTQTEDSTPVTPYLDPTDQLIHWETDFQNPLVESPLEILKDAFSHSIKLHQRHYLGHQVASPAPLTALTQMMIAILNNGMGVYEMGMVGNAMEKIITNLVAKRIGYDDTASGILTSGGTLANLTALLTARATMTKVWQEGTTEKLAVMVSEEAHYCIDRAARIMGLGAEGIIKIPVNDQFQIRTELLEPYFQTVQAKGYRVLCVIGSACTTSTGSYDNLEAIADFCQSHQIWFHADGAHGGAVIFSEKYKHLVKGIQRADSVVLDFHKMLLTPSLSTALIFKRAADSYQTFAQKAAYLWADQDTQEWYNSGKRTFECTKPMTALTIYTLLRTYGESLFSENVDYLYDLTKQFALLIQSTPHFELALEPQCNILCFRYLKKENLNEINTRIRERLLKEGKFYIVQTNLHGQTYLRVSLMNPLTTITDLQDLLREIQTIA